MLQKILTTTLLLAQIAHAQSISTETLPADLTGSSSGASVTTTAPAPESKATNATQDKAMERVEVTGSHIRRIESEGVAPVQTVTRKAMEDSGYDSVADVLRGISANSFGSARETAGSSTPGYSDIDLRGLGSDKTLVLLDGQRLPSDAINGGVDINLIPMAAVERIDILKDGASAIYGSDALGGVVNIITRKDFTGNEVTVSQSATQLAGGQKQSITGINGIGGDGWNVVNVLSYRKDTGVYSKNRTWDRYMSRVGNPGSYIDTNDNNAKFNAAANCPSGLVLHSSDGDYCQFPTSNYSTSLPDVQQLGLMSSATMDVSSRLRLNARISATQRHAGYQYAPALDSDGYAIPSSVATADNGGHALPGLTAPGDDVGLLYRLTPLGARQNNETTNAYNMLLGANIQLEGSWSMDVNTSQNQVWTSNKGTNGYALKSTVQSLITSGAFNPFSNTGSLASAAYTPTENSTTMLNSLEVKASGDLTKISSGTVGIALGAIHTSQRYEDDTDAETLNGNVVGDAGSSGAGSRQTNAAYTELSIPVIKDLELQLALRYDQYSDFGSSTNPKIGFMYHPAKEVLIRGSWGTGFEAPTMQELYAGKSLGAQTFIDHVKCNQNPGDPLFCKPNQWTVTSSGNKGLKDQKSESLNLGAVYEPKLNSTWEFNVGLDGWYTKLSNVIGIDYGSLTQAEAAGKDVSSYGITVQRDPSTGEIVNINSPALNLSKQQISGLDLTASLGKGRFKLTTDHALVLYYRQEGFPGTGYDNKLGQFFANGALPPWRNTTSLGYHLADRHELQLVALTTAGSQKADPTAGNLATYTNYDLVYNWTIKPKKESVSIVVKNLFGTTPPLDDSNQTQQLNPQLYDEIGRAVYATYKMGF